ncbi:MAG TPA: hypothetical protein VK843_11985 [Planctomycetota bacterium]|nr:hypothetical protein [Planctomycetota bacterium]
MKQNFHAWRSLLAVAILGSFSGCASPGLTEIAWEPVVCYQARGPIERVRSGRPDPRDRGLQAVSVDQAGDVALMHFERGVPRSEVIHQNRSELTGLLITDADSALPGEEIYAGGYAGGNEREGTGGVVLQLARPDAAQGAWSVRRIYEGSAFVHSIERVEPLVASEVVRLLVSTYAGEIHLLTPTPGSGPWEDSLLYREPPNPDPEAIKIKDATFLTDASGRRSHEALIALKMGRTLFLDVDHPDRTRLIHEELGGLSRVTSDGQGGAYITGYFGRVLHFLRDGEGFQVVSIEQEAADSGLRGLVLGDFPVTGATARMAIFGFHKLCRALVSRHGVLDPVTIYVDIDRGHAIEAADLIQGNGADEILIGGYSNRITMLVAQRK